MFRLPSRQRCLEGVEGLPGRVSFCHLSQQLSHPVVLLREPTVASRVLLAFLAISRIALLGCFLVYLCGPLLTGCGFFKAVSRESLGYPHPFPRSLGSINGAECLSGRPQVRVKWGLAAALCACVCHLRGLPLSLTAGLTLLSGLNRCY
jgi:hypothetical protein